MAPPPSLTRKVVNAAAWMVGARFLMRALNLVCLLVVARLLTPADFGIAAAATALLIVAETVTDLQFSQALIRKREIVESDWDTAWTLNLLRGILLAAMLVAAAPLIAGLLGAPEAAPAFAIIGLAPLLRGCANPRFVLFERAVSLRQEFYAMSAGQAATIVVTIGVALVRPDYWALVAGALAAPAVQTVLSYGLIRYRPRFGLAGARSLASFSGWLMGARALSVINDQSDRFFLLARLDAAALGVYRLGQSILMLPLTDLIHPLTRGLFPTLAQFQDDPQRMRDAYLKAQQTILILCLPIGFGLPFVATPLIALALGPDWSDASLIIQYLAPVVAIQMVGASVEAVAMAKGRTGTIFLRAAIFAAIRIPLLFAGVMLGGLTGLLLARVVTGLINTYLILQMLRALMRLSAWSILQSSYRSWAAALTMTAVLALLTPTLQTQGDVTRICATIGAGVLAYVIALVVLWLATGRKSGPESWLLDRLAHLRRGRRNHDKPAS